MDASIQKMVEQAYSCLTEGNFEDALEAFSDCLLLEPAEAKIYYGRGTAHFQLKQWPLAISDFKKAQELNPEDPENSSGLALSLAMDNKIYEAIDVYETLLTAHPRFIRAHIQLALLYYQLGIIPKGHKQLDIALASKPSPDERQRIETLKKEQMTLDKRRYYKPDFEALRKQNKVSGGFLKNIRALFGK